MQWQPRLGTSQLTPPSARPRSLALPTDLSPRDPNSPPPQTAPTRERGPTVPMQSVRLGGGALGFALPKKRFMAAVGLRLGDGSNNDRAGPEAQRPLRACALLKAEVLAQRSATTSGHTGRAANPHWLCGEWAVLSRAHLKGHRSTAQLEPSLWQDWFGWIEAVGDVPPALVLNLIQGLA